MVNGDLPSSRTYKNLWIKQKSIFFMTRSLTTNALQRKKFTLNPWFSFKNFSGDRKSMTSIVVFDVNRKCFVGEIVLRVQGLFCYYLLLKLNLFKYYSFRACKILLCFEVSIARWGNSVDHCYTKRGLWSIFGKRIVFLAQLRFRGCFKWF